MKSTLDPEKFYNFCGEVREKFYAIAPWVTMWPALHKVSIVVGLLIYFSMFVNFLKYSVWPNNKTTLGNFTV